MTRALRLKLNKADGDVKMQVQQVNAADVLQPPLIFTLGRRVKAAVVNEEPHQE